MTLYIGVVSQKGGVGKSTVSRLIAREYAEAGWRVKIADMDISQATSSNWNRRRMHQNLKPEISVETFGRITEPFKSNDYDLIVFDGAPQSSRMTLDIAKAVHLVIIPTGVSLDDLEPSVKLAHELKSNGVETRKISFVLNGVGSSEAEIEEAVNYLTKTPYTLLKGALPDKTAYRKASDYGKALTETNFESLNQKAAEVVQSIINQVALLN